MVELVLGYVVDVYRGFVKGGGVLSVVVEGRRLETASWGKVVLGY